MINGALVEKRRRHVGLSVRRLARAVGVSPGRIERVEQNHGGERWSLSEVNRLAVELAVEVVDLLRPIDDADGTESLFSFSDEVAAAQLGAALLDARSGASLASISEALAIAGSDFERVRSLLEERLRPCGLALDRRGGRLRLVRAVDTPTTQITADAMARSRVDERGLDVAAAEVLSMALAGRLKDHTLSQRQRAQIGMLRQVGLLVDTSLAVTAEALDNLLLTNAPQAGASPVSADPVA